MISIVMAYINRKKQLINTLNSIILQNIKNIEIIIVNTSIDENLKDIYDTYHHQVTLHIYNDKDYTKKYCGVTVAYNKAISLSSGNILLIQNPECYHFGNIIETVQQYLTDTNYISFATLALNEQLTNDIKVIDNIYISSIVSPGSVYLPCWYNHSKYHPKYYHFCSAITRNNCYNIGGFDEQFSYGIAYDDDDFVARIRFLGLTLQIIDSPCVFHQYHGGSYSLAYPSELAIKNYDLYQDTLNTHRKHAKQSMLKEYNI